MMMTFKWGREELEQQIAVISWSFQSLIWKCFLFDFMMNIYTFLGFLCSEVLTNPQVEVDSCREIYNQYSCSFKEWWVYWLLRKVVIQKYLSLFPFTLFLIRIISSHGSAVCVCQSSQSICFLFSKKNINCLVQIKYNLTNEQRS